jgi:chemotaxis protein histidine kinase CheA
MLSEQQQRIMGYFIEEAKDHLNTIEQGLLNLQTTIADPEMVSEVFRAAHSVKGGAAMLGLSSIQHTSHRLEDYFKVLKECPVQVDQRLETLFLRIFDSLHELIDQLQGPFGLTEDKAEEVMAEVEPVFGELGQHLNLLVSQSGRALPEDVELVPAAAVSQKPLTTPQPAIAREESALQLIFQSDVPAQLREMLQLFKQADTDTSRQQLCSLCRVLAQAGEQLDLPNWCGLLGIVEQAIANGNNTYRALAPIVIKDVKHAQELVLVGQSSEISASEALLNLLPPVEQFAEEESITDTTDFADLLADARSTSSNDDALAAEFTIADVTDTEAEEAIDGDWLTLGFSQQGLSASDNPLDASSEGINFDLDADFGTEEEAFNFDALGLNEEELSAPLADAFDLRVDQFDEPAATASVNRTGPEVGVAELNSLADLFEGEVPDLGFTWEEEQVLHSSSDSFAESLAGDTSGDFSDLLFEPEASEELAFDEVEDDDLSGLLNSSAQWANYSARTPDRSEIGSNELSLADEFDSSFAASLESSPEAGSSQDDFENALFSSGPEPLEVDEESLFNSSSPETVTVNGFENLDDLLAGLEVDAIDSDLNAPTELSDLDQIFGSTLTESESLWEEADSATQDIDLLNLGLDTDLENTDLESIDLGNTGLESIDLESVNLENTDLENTALESMDLEPIEQDSSSEEEPFDWNAIDLTADLWEDSPATSVDSSDSSGLAPEGLEEDLTESFTLDSEVQPEAHQPELAAEDLIESFTLESEVQPEPGLADFGEQDTFIQDEPQDDLFQNNLFQDELFQTADQDELFQTAEVIEDSELTADAEPLDSSLFDFSSEQTEAAPSSQTDEAGIDLAGMDLDISFENEFSASNFSDFELTSDSSPFEIAFNDSAFEEDASSMADFSQDSLAEDEQTAIEEPSTLLDLEWAEPSAEDNLIAMSLEDNIPEASDSTPEAVNFDPFLLADDELLEGSLTAY